MHTSRAPSGVARPLQSARPNHRGARNVRRGASFGDKLRDIWEKSQFENWAPKSSRAWRLRQVPSEVGSRQRQEEADDFSNSLERRMMELSKDAQSVAPADKPATSFVGSTDDDLAAALNSRLAMSSGDSIDEDTFSAVAADAPLTPEELIGLVEKKYKNRYDMTIARRNFAGKAFVSLNIMWVHAGQRSFPMTEEEFMDKCDGICMLLNVWNKQTQVRAFLKEKPTSKHGMPPRPIVGVAVALQLDLAPEVVEEWLGNSMS